MTENELADLETQFLELLKIVQRPAVDTFKKRMQTAEGQANAGRTWGELRRELDAVSNPIIKEWVRIKSLHPPPIYITAHTSAPSRP